MTTAPSGSAKRVPTGPSTTAPVASEPAATPPVRTVFEPPVTMIAALLAVTVLIGLAAAILPARRVRRMSIVGALAETG
ncbi:hypothetical protein ACWGGS_01995 [Streptomyces decoyicus]